MGETKNEYNIFSGNHLENTHLEDQKKDDRSSSRRAV
jgi:hypothetical protein